MTFLAELFFSYMRKYVGRCGLGPDYTRKCVGRYGLGPDYMRKYVGRDGLGPDYMRKYVGRYGWNNIKKINLVRKSTPKLSANLLGFDVRKSNMFFL